MAELQRPSTGTIFALSTLAVLTLLSASPVFAAEHIVEARSNNRFEPANLTIEAGDTVTWLNAGGFHNVRATDGSFRCANGCDGQGGNGDPSLAAWEFSLIFNDPGTIDYDCEVHVSLGMVGSITVTVDDGGDDTPGELRFGQSQVEVGEGAGMATLMVMRMGGDDGAVSVEYQTSDGSATAGMDYTPANGTLDWADNDDDPKFITVPILNDNIEEADETVNVMLSSPGGGATLGAPSTATLTITDDDDAAPPPPPPPPPALGHLHTRRDHPLPGSRWSFLGRGDVAYGAG